MLDNNKVIISSTNNTTGDNSNGVIVVDKNAQEERVKAILANAKQKVAQKNFVVQAKLEHMVLEEESFSKKPVQEYVACFKKQVARTARETLEMCRTTYEASKTLDSGEFFDFCKQIGFNDYSSTIRKFIVIGKLYPRLVKYAEQLPIGWTNIYMLTQISADDFEKCVAGNYLNSLKGKELKELLDKTKNINDIKSPFKLDMDEGAYKFGQILFTKLPDDLDWYNIEKALNEVALRLPVKFALNSEAKQKFILRRDKRYETLKQEDDAIAYEPQKWDFGQVAREVIEM